MFMQFKPQAGRQERYMNVLKPQNKAHHW